MNVLADFENSALELQRLLAVLTPLNAQDGPPAITIDWMMQAQRALANAHGLLAHPSFSALKSQPQVQHYRHELLRLKTTLEHVQQHLIAQRSAIRSEQMRLKRVQSLAGTLEALV